VGAARFFRRLEVLEQELAWLVWELRALGTDFVLSCTKTEIEALLKEKRRRLRRVAKADKMGLAGIIAVGTWGG